MDHDDRDVGATEIGEGKAAVCRINIMLGHGDDRSPDGCLRQDTSPCRLRQVSGDGLPGEAIDYGIGSLGLRDRTSRHVRLAPILPIRCPRMV